ncbi:hypothetical protein JTE90_028655 [Oedothorax gibbosus]|uniref:Uncharacterized protein n=1 Tax=Oedothorax gibbosus TaxID=931172 RepID=A0AAV6UXP2_9ARAC|nr:hypothetical protein JTE90_028655 [Oedothorax gibbosus]
MPEVRLETVPDMVPKRLLPLGHRSGSNKNNTLPFGKSIQLFLEFLPKVAEIGFDIHASNFRGFRRNLQQHLSMVIRVPTITTAEQDAGFTGGTGNPVNGHFTSESD